MAVPRRSWLVFGFSPEEAAGEPELGPGPRRLESGPEGVRRVWPAWSYVVVETGAGLELRSAGLRRALPGWVEALPSETHLVLRGPAGARAWPRAAALRGELGVAPAWSRDPPPGSLEPRDPLPLLPGGFVIPRPPFFSALPAGLRARRLVLGCEHVLVLGAVGEIFTWGGGRRRAFGHCRGAGSGPFCWPMPQALWFLVHPIDLLNARLGCDGFTGVQKAAVDQSGSRAANSDRDLLLVQVWLWEALWTFFWSNHRAGHRRLSYKIHCLSHVTIRSRNGLFLLRRVREDDISE
ncbi:RCC1 domain-containing protein 1 isoform X4 [Columba livia]|uniref:RCC1 domain-containing protein 1 isoform X4 n=1 Tax=Columba livia TaxID=8932 RepID=UPI0031BA3CB1